MDDRLADAARRLLGVPEVALERLPGGGNNRVYRVLAPGGACILKHYFRHPGDPRDRLDAEFRFSTHAWEAGIRDLPRPLGRDDGAGVGLYAEWPGHPLVPAEVDAGAVRQALDFVRALDRSRDRPSAGALPVASEAAFSLAGHLQVVEARLGRLQDLDGAEAVDREAATFLREALLPAWERVRAQVSGAGGHLQEVRHRILSPSDFGFHNALRREDGRLGFLDFEYAGWDDPAKLVCDFFTQVARPVGPEHFPRFAEGVAALDPEPEVVLARIGLLRPVYRLKWCCILLNAFLPLDRARRHFAQPPTGDAKALQLHKARHLLTLLWEP